MTRIIGIDPGLVNTGWGVIETKNNQLSFIACGSIKTTSKEPDTIRLAHIHTTLTAVLQKYAPQEAGIEDTFVSKNAKTSLKLGQARGVALLSLTLKGLNVGEYAPTAIKQAIVSYGRADKNQIMQMLKLLLPKAAPKNEHEADALAIAITHAHHSVSLQKFKVAV